MYKLPEAKIWYEDRSCADCLASSGLKSNSSLKGFIVLFCEEEKAIIDVSFCWYSVICVIYEYEQFEYSTVAISLHLYVNCNV